MSRRMRRDVIVVGAGVVGAACALALARAGLEVALVEARTAARFSVQDRDLRVYALAPDNAALLDEIGVWQDICKTRAQPYRKMWVSDAARPDTLVFSADDFARRELGWIVENNLLADRLWQGAQAAGVETLSGACIGGFEPLADGIRLTLEGGEALEARLVVAADGANSRLRELAGIPVSEHDYRQQGVVAYVQLEKPHQHTAWQRFLPTGPLAFLPCDDERLCSIVWSLPNDEAERVLALDEDAFALELAHAFAGRFGGIRLASRRVAFPLKRRLARQQCQGRLLLMGDAAHAVHPLAGQGVNLGLRDVAAFYQSVKRARAKGADFASSARLQRWARERRSDNVLSSYAFEAINRVYSNDSLPLTLLRGRALGIADAIAPLRHALWRHAAGIAV
ncbi:2-octaprenyl-3-methyl-6-methoxy-1,4-benzoquinol hydroxylase [Lysobacteraceae bacterium NML07-0707]|nr:2-octaprenyl-3-methyl-6-methoxy-1,4-benzoquinol hydroxylase [Xanthomonadaceae bacterium NML07-0707]